MGLLDALGAGRAGLAAATAGVTATSHNVANASTPGFTRRAVEQSTAASVVRSGVHIGRGPTVDGITRQADSLLGMRRIGATGDEARSGERLSLLRQAEEVLGTDVGSVRHAVDGVFDALTRATQDPADVGLRGEVVAALDGLATSFAGTATHLAAIRDVQPQRVVAAVGQANETLQDVASLNAQIEAAGGASVAGDLADERDRLVTELARELGAEAHLDGEGNATVLLDGHALVSGAEARSLSVDTTGDVPTLLVDVDRGQVRVEAGGRVGGAIDGAAQVQGTLDALDTLAQELGTALNDAHGQGFARDGSGGGALLSWDPADAAASLAVAAAVAADPDQLAFAGASSAAAGDGDNLAVLLGVEGQDLPSGQPPGAAMSSIVSDIGRASASAQRANAQHTTVLSDLEAMTANLEGVDLDQEAAELIRYQAAYQAAARVMTATDRLLGTLLELV